MAKKNTKEKEGVSPAVTENVAENKTAKKGAKTKRSAINAAIIGISKLFAVVSIVYSDAIIILGTEGIMPLIMITPQTLLAGYIVIKQFIKN